MVRPQGQHATPVLTPKSGQFALQARALHGNPDGGHTLEPAVAEVEGLTGIKTGCIHVDKGYRGHSHPHSPRVRISAFFGS